MVGAEKLLTGGRRVTMGIAISPFALGLVALARPDLLTPMG
jgi:hypothetical protein